MGGSGPFLFGAFLFLTAFNQPGGELTIDDRDRTSFGRFAPGSSEVFQSEFFRGRRIFHSSWVKPEEKKGELRGLGPLYNAESCSTCHTNDGRGRPNWEREIRVDGVKAFEAHPSLVILLSIPSSNIFEEPDPTYGFQFQPKGASFPGEGRVLIQYEEKIFVYPDGSKKALRRPRFHLVDLKYGPLHKSVVISPRLAPAVFGLGLLEAIAVKDLMSLHDPDDLNNDGISGRASVAWDFAFQQKSFGRFGWRASHPTLQQQNASAAVNDMSLMNRIFEFETITHRQANGKSIPSAGTPENPYELQNDQLSRLTFYTHLLAVPRQDQSKPGFAEGRKLFIDVGCGNCHVPNWQTDFRYEGLEILAGQEIEPYTDLLLHHMGEDLADKDLSGRTYSSEWRTPPLWGIGLHGQVNGNSFFLHDGRARDIEEAILWHGGEATEARKKFVELDVEDREKIFRFLEGL